MHLVNILLPSSVFFFMYADNFFSHVCIAISLWLIAKKIRERLLGLSRWCHLDISYIGSE